MNNSHEQKLVVISPNHCGMCQPTTSSNVAINMIEQGDAGWKLNGTGRILVECPDCRAIYEAVITAIPIQCSNYSCPDCGQTEQLNYKIKKIDAQGMDFHFQAEIECSKCNSKRTIIKVLKNLLKIKKIEIKLTGISIER